MRLVPDQAKAVQATGVPCYILTVAKSPLRSKPLNECFYRLGYIKCAATNRVELTAMMALLKRMRWVALLACYVVIARTCRLFRIALPMDSFWRPHNLRRFRPYLGAPRTVCYFRAMPPRRGK